MLGSRRIPAIHFYWWRRFLGETALELRKVDWFTQSELITYSAVVFATVMALILFVAAIELAFAKLILGVFGS
jgi:preprotein translocase SecE subunit